MKPTYLIRFVAGLLLLSHATAAQVLTIGTAGMTVPSGAILSVGSLVLQPSATLSLRSNSITGGTAPVSIAPGASIDEVFTFGVPVTYSGAASLFYTPAALNGNTAANLIMAYNATATGPYTLNCSSTVNTATDEVSSAALHGAALDNVTATQSTTAVAGITGVTSVCGGSSVTLSDATAGGSWSSSHAAVATIGSGGLMYGVSAGTATISYTVNNGCHTAVATTVVTVLAQPVISTGPAAAVCSGSSATLTAAGGMWYSWSPATGLSATTGPSVVAHPASTTNYIVTGTAENGCSNMADVTVTVTTLSISASVANATCNGLPDGEITATASGGTAVYSYTWSAGGGIPLFNILLLAPASTYTVTAADAHGCRATASYTVTQPAPISIAGTTTGVSCYEGSNGGINTTVSGGTPGYSYLWSNGARTADISGLPTGIYSLGILDGNGCAAIHSYTITQPAPISIAGATTGVSCYGDHNGSISATASGGTPGYSYLWSNGSRTADIGGLAAGTYSLGVTDANGCPATHSYTVAQPPALALTAVVTDVTSAGGSNGSINTTVTGGTPAYSYLWSNGSRMADQAGLVAGAYTVNVTDARGCTASGAYTITQPTKGKGNARTTAGDTSGSHSDGPAAITDPSIKVYPNPNNGSFSVAGSAGVSESTEGMLEVTDMLGQRVYSRKVTTSNGMLNEQVQLSNVANGMYLLEVSFGGGSEVFHIVVAQ